MDPRFPEPKMRDEFRRELRARLITEAQTALAPRPRGTGWRTWLRPALGVGLAGLVLAAGAGTAAAGSVPGDPAFTLKRAVEDLQVTLTFDDVQRVQLLAEITDRRLADLEKVADQSDKAPTASEEYAAAVTRFRAAVDALQQTAPQDKADKAQDVADAARDKHEALLEVIEPKVPEEAKPALERAKEEENRDADNGRTPGRNERPNGTRSPDPRGSPRATQDLSPRSSEPRATDRPLTPRPSGSVRPLPTPRASGEVKDGSD